MNKGFMFQVLANDEKVSNLPCHQQLTTIIIPVKETKGCMYACTPHVHVLLA